MINPCGIKTIGCNDEACKVLILLWKRNLWGNLNFFFYDKKVLILTLDEFYGGRGALDDLGKG